MQEEVGGPAGPGPGPGPSPMRPSCSHHRCLCPWWLGLEGEGLRLGSLCFQTVPQLWCSCRPAPPFLRLSVLPHPVRILALSQCHSVNAAFLQHLSVSEPTTQHPGTVSAEILTSPFSPALPQSRPNLFLLDACSLRSPRVPALLSSASLPRGPPTRQPVAPPVLSSLHILLPALDPRRSSLVLLLDLHALPST